jgi:hypothetical protein
MIAGPFCRMNRKGQLVALKCRGCGAKMRGPCIEPLCKPCGGVDHIVIQVPRKRPPQDRPKDGGSP